MPRAPGRLYLWVLAGIVAGGLIGAVDPALGVALKPLGDGFIALIKMLIAPVIFLTVVLGVTGAGSLQRVGRVGLKALLYFELLSSLALAAGLLVANGLSPGAGFNVNPATLDASAVEGYAQKACEQNGVDFVLRIIPKTFFDAFGAGGDLLQVLLVAVLFALALSAAGARAQALHAPLESLSRVFFGMVNLVMRLAPLGAGGAMAFTVGKYGVASLAPLARLMGCFYLSCVLFVLLALGAVARLCGFSILRFVLYIKDELLLVLGTSSSESALPALMEKMERAGCPRSIVGLVVPAGYSFNLDGTNIYLTLAVLFVAQALNIELTLAQQLSVLAVAMLTSKGASGVTGSGFVTLAATLAVVPAVPVAGLALILGIDRFMSEARALTNFVGNGVACVAVSRWEGELDRAALARELRA